MNLKEKFKVGDKVFTLDYSKVSLKNVRIEFVGDKQLKIKDMDNARMGMVWTLRGLDIKEVFVTELECLQYILETRKGRVEAFKLKIENEEKIISELQKTIEEKSNAKNIEG